MKWLLKARPLSWYGLLFASTFFADRLTKYYALTHFSALHKVNEWLSYHLAFNRGVSWAFFHSESSVTFTIVSAIILLVTLAVGAYTCIRWANHNGISGEILVLAGAVSNLLDRAWYGGVADFIIISLGSWSFPTFNVADVAIVFGVCAMIIGIYKES